MPPSKPIMTYSSNFVLFCKRLTCTSLCSQEEEDITTSDRYISTYDNGQCTLTINNVTVDEEAEFTCKAVNEAGTVTTFVDIFVESKTYSSPFNFLFISGNLITVSQHFKSGILLDFAASLISIACIAYNS